ncbi:MAG TPA: glucose-6-phosphate isomerase [candidate division Zixibacteria bacterium]|nr:glucose-6-phosphate isomerase [candidate division Zixibacteria bacterium]
MTGKNYDSAEFQNDNRLKLDLTYIVNALENEPFISCDELDRLAPRVIEQHRKLNDAEGDCLDKDTPMLGWLSLPEELTDGHLDAVQEAADELAGKVDVFLSLGIGGSYLGIEATIKALGHTYANQLPRSKRNNRPEIYFLGQNVDPDMFVDTLNLIEGKRIGVNVISKSGTTTETAIAFRIVRKLLEESLGDRASEFIIATTDRVKGALRKLSEQKGYRTFVVPDNVGGRFSVLTDVGLLGLAVAGVDIREFVAGFRAMKQRTDTDEFWANPAMLHAAVRHLSFEKGKRIEVVATNSTALYQLTRWMEQLFPESEGHRGYGLWVSPSMYSEKLHANGQMVQQGPRLMIETFLRLRDPEQQEAIPSDPEDADGLEYLCRAGLDMNAVNQLVIDGPAYAHFLGGVPNMTIEIPRRNAFNFGQFYFLMERSVALSGYLAGHNPFIQPGVEDYKRAMFALAGKPGFEQQGEKVREAIANMDHVIVD